MTPQFAVIGIVTPDMSASLAFYRRLGLDIPAEADSQAHVQAALPGGLRLLWDTAENIASFDPDYALPRGGSRIGLGFACESPAHVDKVYAELTEAGYRGYKAPWDAFWDMRYAIVHDPDGNDVSLFAPLNAD